MEYEQLAYDAALRALDNQERVLDELRGRTGILLGASALAASFLGKEAFADPSPALAVPALLTFVATIACSVFILVPRQDQFVFSLSGPRLYEGLFEVKDDLAEVHRRLAYDMHAFWQTNDARLQPLFKAYRIGAAALVTEILALVTLVSGSIF